jgi:anti-anti-sigma factor
MAKPLKATSMLHLTLKSQGRSTIIFCHGRLVWSEEGTLLKAIFFVRDCDRLTLDLTGVDSIDARGLAVLATIAKWASRKRVKFAVSNPTRRVYELIHLVSLDSVISVHAIEPVPFDLGIEFNRDPAQFSSANSLRRNSVRRNLTRRT